MTMLDPRPKTDSSKSERPPVYGGASVTGESSEADIIRGWIAYFHANPMHPDVQARLGNVASEPWKKPSREDVVWAMGQAAAAWAKLGELPPPIETPLAPADSSDSQIVHTNGVSD